MKKNILGNTGLEVTELCFGTLPMGPLQKNLELSEGAELIAAALKNGINFIDTAQFYKTYPYIREAIKISGIRPIIASKSTAESYSEMEKAVFESLTALDIKEIDIFHIHAPRASVEVLEQRKGAIKCLIDLRAKGIIKAVGIATHDVKLAEIVSELNEIDILFPIYNKNGKGILNGGIESMTSAIKKNFEAGKGVYLMKTLGGGTMLKQFVENIEFARKNEFHHSIALGMVNINELKFNIDYFNGKINSEPPSELIVKKEVKVVTQLCKTCEKCVKFCPNSAISILENKAFIDQAKCIACGYCTEICPAFAIRVV